MSTAPLPYATVTGPPNNRRSALIAFGIVAIVLGAMAGCGALLMPVAIVMQNVAVGMGAKNIPPPDVRGMVMGLLVYAVMSAALIWLGIGSCKCRRWTRPLVLCIGWPAVISMIVSMLVYALMLPAIIRMMQANIQATPGATPAAATGAVIGGLVGGGVAMLFMLGVPIAFVAFFRSPHVRSTLEYYDPGPSWTDGRPLPVLGLSIWLFIVALMLLANTTMLCVPAFGAYVTGVAAVLLMLVSAALLAVAGVLVYRRRVAGWWIALAFAAVAPASFIVTIAHRGLISFYEAARFPPDQIRQMRDAQVFDGAAVPAMMAVMTAGVIAALLWVRKRWDA